MAAHGTRAIDAARRAGISFTIHEYDHDPRASQRDGGPGYALEAAAALGVDPAGVYKTLVASVDDRLVVAVVPATSELDLKRLADAAGGRRSAMAGPAAAERATGYVPGGISPLGLRRAMAVIVDESSMERPTIHISAGRRGLEIELAPSDLVRLTAATVAPIARRA
jgi:Cys-tRNA(Pro)/Cys-tRNA(Cys) deacylase